MRYLYNHKTNAGQLVKLLLTLTDQNIHCFPNRIQITEFHTMKLITMWVIWYTDIC